MLTSETVKKIGRGGVRLAAVLAGLNVPVAVAKFAGYSQMAAAGGANSGCVEQSAVHAAITLGHAVWGMLDACILGQMAHAAGVLLASDSTFNPVHAVAGIIGHEVATHLVVFVFQILS